MLNVIIAYLVLSQPQVEPTIADVMKATGCDNSRQVIPSDIRMSYDFALLSEDGEILLHTAEDGFVFAPNDSSMPPTIAKIVYLQVKPRISHLGTMTQFNIEDAAVNGHFAQYPARPLAIEMAPALTCLAFGGIIGKTVGWIDVNAKDGNTNINVSLPKSWISQNSEFLSGHLIQGKAIIYTQHITKQSITIRKIIVQKSGRMSRYLIGTVNHPKGSRYRLAGVLARQEFPVVYDEADRSTVYLLKNRRLTNVLPCPGKLKAQFSAMGAVLVSYLDDQYVLNPETNKWVRISPWVIVASNSSGTRYLVTAPGEKAWVLSRS